MLHLPGSLLFIAFNLFLHARKLGDLQHYICVIRLCVWGHPSLMHVVNVIHDSLYRFLLLFIIQACESTIKWVFFVRLSFTIDILQTVSIRMSLFEATGLSIVCMCLTDKHYIEVYSLYNIHVYYTSIVRMYSCIYAVQYGLCILYIWYIYITIGIFWSEWGYHW